MLIARALLASTAGEWENAVRIAEQGLDDPALRAQGPSYFTLRAVRALARGVLGRDVATCIEQLEESREAFSDFGLAVSEAESNAFIGRLLAQEGRFEEARAALESALQLYSELNASEGRANAHSLLARLHRERGNHEASRRHGDATLEIYNSVRRLRRRPWSGALAAWVLAEEGGLADARAFARRHAKSLDCPDLPASQHATHLALARIAELDGDPPRVRDHLERAHRAAAEVDLVAPLPDIDPELLRWGGDAVRRLGLDARIADRFDPTTRPETDRAPPLRITTLGAFRVEREGDPIESRAWRGANAQRLLQRLLVANGRPLSREQIGVDFWPDASPAKARGSLRVALNKLRQALEPGRAAGDPERWLHVDGEHLALRDEALAGWDVAQWRRRLDESAGADGGEAAALRAETLRDYGGPFLPDNLEDWAGQLSEWGFRDINEEYLP